jgi:threonine/homoserine/homoserine lactone efflux protein
VKVIGGLYLVWLGWKLWTSEPEAPPPDRLAAAGEFRRNLVGGLVLTLGNPKAIAFYAAFLPTFIDLTRITAADIAIIAAVIAGVLMVTNTGYGLLAARARVFFKSRRAMRNLNRAAGTMMVGAGVAVAAR